MFDNSKKVGMNLEVGTKLKVSYKNYNSKVNQKRNFNNFSVNLIHHQPIIDNLILSPGLRKTGGFIPIPTPAGVPVVTISPGCKDINLLK